MFKSKWIISTFGSKNGGNFQGPLLEPTFPLKLLEGGVNEGDYANRKSIHSINVQVIIDFFGC